MEVKFYIRWSEKDQRGELPNTPSRFIFARVAVSAEIAMWWEDVTFKFSAQNRTSMSCLEKWCGRCKARACRELREVILFIQDVAAVPNSQRRVHRTGLLFLASSHLNMDGLSIRKAPVLPGEI